jgi:hypothetical protein
MSGDASVRVISEEKPAIMATSIFHSICARQLRRANSERQRVADELSRTRLRSCPRATWRSSVGVTPARYGPRSRRHACERAIKDCPSERCAGRWSGARVRSRRVIHHESPLAVPSRTSASYAADAAVRMPDRIRAVKGMRSASRPTRAQRTARPRGSRRHDRRAASRVRHRRGRATPRGRAGPRLAAPQARRMPSMRGWADKRAPRTMRCGAS